jgi:hypothetical protein
MPERATMTQATMARPDTPRRSLPSFPLVTVVLAGALLCVAMAYALREPDFVPRVTVDNPSPLDINVSVRSTPDGPRLLLATVPGQQAVSNQDVLDQGDEWIFAFASGGVDGGTLRVPRAKLAGDDWRVTVPDDVLARLRSGSYTPVDR